MMDAKMMMDQMDAARAVMHSQVQALNSVTATPMALEMAGNSPESVFDACLQAQWGAVGQALNALSQAEGEARNALFANAAGLPKAAPVAPAPPADADVIDVTAREVQT